MTDQGSTMSRRHRRRQMLQASQQQEVAKRLPSQPENLLSAQGTMPKAPTQSQQRASHRAGSQSHLRLNLKQLLSGQPERRLLPPARTNGQLVVSPSRSSAIAPTTRRSARESGLRTSNNAQRLPGPRDSNSIDDSLWRDRLLPLTPKAATREAARGIGAKNSPLSERQTQVSSPIPGNSSGSRTRSGKRTRQRSPKLHRSQPTAQSIAELKRKAAQRSQLRRSVSPLLYGTRLLILGLGIGVIAGTLLSTLDPSRFMAGASQTAINAKSQTEQQAKVGNSAKLPMPLKLSQEAAPLKAEIQGLTRQTSGLTPGVFLIDLDTTTYVDLNGTAVFPAASTIKVPVLVAFFQDVDAGKIRLDELLTMKPELIGSGSGDMQYQPPGTKFSALDTASRMITISDNTATNMLIARLGGVAALNRRFQSWGLTATVINNPLPDLQGTNTTSPRDLTTLMAWVNQGDLVSMRSRDRMLDIMRRTVTDTLLPRGLGEGATIAHKTGDIGSLIGDVGLIDMPNGKRYVITALVKRPFNDGQASELIRQISRVTYNNLSQLGGAANTLPGSTMTPGPGVGMPSPAGNMPLGNPANVPGQGRPMAPAAPSTFNQPPGFNQQ
ncbi:class A beta-lactamase-related serine hydrolase [Trichocoleus desertorum AS-A10]|uniref:serine hydrolase n=1 Tax=Trichocoleus desertorum TaxID=1481672 RepID=UPI00329A76B0